MISNLVLTHVVCALAVLLAAATAVGSLFERIRQPRAIGEILGGLLVGPTVLGAFAPQAVTWLFSPTGVGASALGLVQQLGLLLLLFCAGGEMRHGLRQHERGTVGGVAVTSMLIPAVVAVLILSFQPLHSFWGPAANRPSFILVASIAMAVTSIPVISRIMADLGILETPFARIVLGVAVIEDVVVYVALAIAVGIAAPGTGTAFGLSSALNLSPGSGADVTLHVGMTLLLLALVLLLGKPVLVLAARISRSSLGASNPVTTRLLVLLAATLLALLLGVEPFLAAFAAGIAVSRAGTGTGAAEAQRVVRRFAFGFFVPVYFALVGATLDLRHGFNVAFFGGFFIVACGIKAASVYLGARMSGRTRAGAMDLAVALNARGGPGIVLATTAYGTHIITLNFFAMLVLLAILTSLLAGGYLERRPRSAFGFNTDDEPADTADVPPVLQTTGPTTTTWGERQ